MAAKPAPSHDQSGEPAPSESQPDGPAAADTSRSRTERVLSHIVGTNAFRRRTRVAILNATRHLMTHVGEVAATDGFDNEARKRLRRHFIRAFFSDLRLRYVDLLFSNLFVGAFLSAFAVGPILAAAFMSYEVTWQRWYAVAVYLVLALPLLFLGTWVRTWQVMRRRGATLWELLFVAASASICYELVDRQSPAYWGLFAALAAVGTALAVMNVLGFLFGGIMYRLNRRRARRWPGTLLCVQLFDLLFMAECQQKYHRVTAFRRAAASLLERAAVAVEEFFPHALDPGDAGTAAWLKGEMLEVATGFRECKRVFLMRGSGAITALAPRFRLALVAALDADYEALPRCDGPVPGPADPRSWLRRAGHVLLIGGIPVAALAALQLSPLALEGKSASYAASAVGLWVILTILEAIDPAFSRKVDAVRDVARTVDIPTRTLHGARTRMGGQIDDFEPDSRSD